MALLTSTFKGCSTSKTNSATTELGGDPSSEITMLTVSLPKKLSNGVYSKVRFW